MKRPIPILPATLFGNVFNFHFMTYPEVIIDLGEHYPKQTWRNRCDIVSANGMLSLTVPVVGQKGVKTPLREITIDNSQDWASLHWKSLVSAYRSAPFFDHYSASVEKLYQQEWNHLSELNMATIYLALDWLELTPRINVSKVFVQKDPALLDLRSAFKPTRFESIDFHPPTYTQVFADRFDFFPNCSVLDLIFNLGPEASDYLRKTHFDETQIAILDR